MNMENKTDNENDTINSKKKIKTRHRTRKSHRKDCKTDDTDNTVTEVVNFLCDSLTAVEKFTESTGKEPQPSTSRQNAVEGKTVISQPSTCEEPDLHNLLESLQIHVDKNPVNEANLIEFLNIDLLKRTKCEGLRLEELNKLKQAKSQKADLKVEPIPIPQNKMKDYFNLNLLQNTPEQSIIQKIESSSMTLVSELEYSLIPQAAATSDKKHVGEYFNVSAKDDILSSVQTGSKVLVSELNKTVEQCSKGSKDRISKPAKGQKSKTVAQCSKGPTNCISKSSKGQKLSKTVNEPNKPVEQCSGGSKGGMSKPNKGEKSVKTVEGDKKAEDYRFPPHVPESDVQTLLKYGLMFGTIRINQRNFKEAYIRPPDNTEDILIDGMRERNRALEGDEVYFVIKPIISTVENKHEEPRRTAIVLGIKEKRHNRTTIGTLKLFQDKNLKYALFSPRDYRFPRMRIPYSQWPDAFKVDPKSVEDIIYLAKLVRWEDVRHADGELMMAIGSAGEVEAETSALLLKFGLNVTPYPANFSYYYPASPYVIPPEVLSAREDLRAQCVFTIDPATARDLDDAVSVRKLDNGNFEVGVHISDVSFFLVEGTPLDVAVCNRATTVYLVQQVHHMLPRDLCVMCSLTPGQDKLTFSVLWEVNSQMEIINHRFTRSVINSCAQLFYEQVQLILEGQSCDALSSVLHSHTPTEVTESVLFLNQLAVKLRHNRFDNGALRIDQPKISFRLDKHGLPEEFTLYIQKESHRLIEELMLLANITTAQHIEASFPHLAFLRAHSPPNQFLLSRTCKMLEKFGIFIKSASAGDLQDSLQRYAGEDLPSLARILVLNSLLAKPMMRAAYVCAHMYTSKNDRHHYALNVPLYTHFTSPIRRYADVVVHRLLAASLGYTDPLKWEPYEVQKIAKHCNDQKYAAKLAGEASTDLFFTVWVGMNNAVVQRAVVCDLKNKSFDCVVLSTGTFHRIYYEQIRGRYKLNARDDTYSLKIVWPANPEKASVLEEVQVIEMFSIVCIKLRRSAAMKIDASLIQLSSSS